jgi:hypothetical protein
VYRHITAAGCKDVANWPARTAKQTAAKPRWAKLGCVKKCKEGMKAQCDNVCWRRATKECDAIISVSANAEAAVPAFAGGGSVLTPGRMAATHRVTQGGPRPRFRLWTVDPGRPHIEEQRCTRKHFEYTSHHAVFVTNTASKISDYWPIFESVRGVVWEWHAAPKRVPTAAQESCFGVVQSRS